MLHNQKFDVIHHNEVFKIPLKAITAKDQRLFTQQVTRIMLSLDFSSCSQYALPVFHWVWPRRVAICFQLCCITPKKTTAGPLSRRKGPSLLGLLCSVMTGQATAQPRPRSPQLESGSCTGDSIAAEYRIRQPPVTQKLLINITFISEIFKPACTELLKYHNNVHKKTFYPSCCFDVMSTKIFNVEKGKVILIESPMHECVMCRFDDMLHCKERIQYRQWLWTFRFLSYKKNIIRARCFRI